ncbi:5-oxoprolinase subunit PxpA [Chitinilyticum piscinae]|uniref:5-oxoprolinase subunit PxpA n=1 Tax=Chitinilyticum piscinae TaxID=2866724 RepID=A0A8J7KBB2_9NEIS|nr:5-oxoprolinase subunit PxpA [Chitinilyticum piscinae]MBE9610054.1 5-oxoprolinase subunit PxpA [Chitinilyticum piscinae]
MRHIDLNADLGEGCGLDAALMPWLSSANIACGGHAGDADSMRETVALARRHGLTIGAHPSYPDRAGFGRQPLAMPVSQLQHSLESQLAALQQIAAAQGARVAYVKAHGALYNAAMQDPELAEVLLDASIRVLGAPGIMGLPGSLLLDRAAQRGLPVIREGFADRAYEQDGTLRSRHLPGAVLDDAEAIAQAEAFVLHQQVRSFSGEWVTSRIDSLCLHGDNPAAVRLAQAIRLQLEGHGVGISSTV